MDFVSGYWFCYLRINRTIVIIAYFAHAMWNFQQVQKNRESIWDSVQNLYESNQQHLNLFQRFAYFGNFWLKPEIFGLQKSGWKPKNQLFSSDWAAAILDRKKKIDWSYDLYREREYMFQSVPQDPWFMHGPVPSSKSPFRAFSWLCASFAGSRLTQQERKIRID